MSSGLCQRSTEQDDMGGCWIRTNEGGKADEGRTTRTTLAVQPEWSIDLMAFLLRAKKVSRTTFRRCSR